MLFHAIIIFFFFCLLLFRWSLIIDLVIIFVIELLSKIIFLEYTLFVQLIQLFRCLSCWGPKIVFIFFFSIYVTLLYMIRLPQQKRAQDNCAGTSTLFFFQDKQQIATHTSNETFQNLYRSSLWFSNTNYSRLHKVGIAAITQQKKCECIKRRGPVCLPSELVYSQSLYSNLKKKAS